MAAVGQGSEEAGTGLLPGLPAQGGSAGRGQEEGGAGPTGSSERGLTVVAGEWEVGPRKEGLGSLLPALEEPGFPRQWLAARWPPHHSCPCPCLWMSLM